MYLSSAIQLLKKNYLISNHDGCNAGPKIGDITFSQADVEEAIDDINRAASSTDHDIPDLILKECKNNISYPVFLIWKESFESEVIPEDSKYNSHLQKG